MGESPIRSFGANVVTIMKQLSESRLRAASIAVLAACFAFPASAEDLSATFEILRKGEPIGTHAVTVERKGAETIVETDIRMRVKFGPIPVFSYAHDSREVWRNGAVEEIDSRTDNNGRKSVVTVRRAGAALEVDGTAYKGPAPLDAAPSSYWNRGALVSAPVLLDTQNGRLIDITTQALGVTAAPDGAKAEQFRVVGSVALNLWYDGPRWVGSTFTVRGEDLTYRRLGDSAEFADNIGIGQ